MPFDLGIKKIQDIKSVLFCDFSITPERVRASNSLAIVRALSQIFFEGIWETKGGAFTKGIAYPITIFKNGDGTWSDDYHRLADQLEF